MAGPTLEDVRVLSEWSSPLGAVSVYLRFDPGDRSQTWRAELRNEIGRVRAAVEDADHERRTAVIATTDRLLKRFEDNETRPPPRGEAGFVEVAENGGAESWWPMAVPPARTEAALAEQPQVAALVDIAHRDRPTGVALVSSERVRLLRAAEGELTEIEDMEMTIWSRDWRERKSSRTRDPATAQGVNSSGRDQFEERLDHNRRRFLGEAGSAAARRLKESGLDRVLAFGPAAEVELLSAGLDHQGVQLDAGGDADLISTPTGRLLEVVAEAVERLTMEQDREVAERALGRGDGSRGTTGMQETAAALEEGRIEHLVLDPAVGEAAEALVRGALRGGASVTIARDGVAELLEPAGGVAGILRY